MFFKNFINSIKSFLSLREKEFYEQILNFICGSEALPQPLSDKEEDLLLQELSGDNREEICNKLIEHNLRLVIYIAKKFECAGVESEDLVSIGAIGLIKAVKSYNYDKKIKLATYASRCIENEILMYFRKLVKYKGDVSIDEPLNVDYDGNELLLSDLLTNDEDGLGKQMEMEEEKVELYNAINRLNQTEKMIMEMRFGLNGEKELTQKQVADELGISQSYISRLEKKIFGKIRKDLSKYNYIE
ncbi:MAG: sigma-70 family RNA polymerase sigma factor [Clostridia bacterium]|nr:sigma-70 family RNA polymerase sigma factor [Clostridia bacterium]